MREQRRLYPKEFKTESVELLLSSDREPKELAESLGITPNMLHRWKREFLASKENAFPGNGIIGDPQERELHDLKKELRNIQEERDILKKALAIFSKQTL